MEIPADQIPTGWTTAYDALKGFASFDTGLARLHGVDNATPILMTTGETGEMQFLLTANGRYYWGDRLIDHIFEMTRPEILPAILRALAKHGVNSLRTMELKQVRWDNPIPREESVHVKRR